MFHSKTQTRSLFDVVARQNSEHGKDVGHDSGHGRLSGARSSSEDEVTEIGRLRAFRFRHLEGVAQLSQFPFDSLHPVDEKKIIL